jgi:hypothetical protein
MGRRKESKKLTEEEKSMMLEEYKAGTPVKELCSKYNVPLGSFYFFTKQAGLKQFHEQKHETPSTETATQILQLRLGGKTHKEAAGAFGYSAYISQQLCKKQNIPTRFGPSENEVKLITEAYQSGKSQDVVAEQFGYSQAFISDLLIEHNQTRTQPDSMRLKNPLNEDYFQTIDTEAKAFFLGLITADGNITENNGSLVFQIGLHIQDRDILEKFVNELGYSQSNLKEISEQKIHQKTGESYQYNSIKFFVASKRFCEHLIALQIYPRKSTKEIPWNGPKHLLPAYWCGVVCGDGSIYKTKVGQYDSWGIGLVGSEAVCAAFRQWLVDSGINTESKVRLTKSKANIKTNEVFNLYSFVVQGTLAPQQVAKLLFDNATIYMERKYQIAKTLIETEFKSRLSKYRGVSLDKKPNLLKPWWAYITVNGKQKYLGNFRTEREAALAYNASAKEFFGAEAFQNIIPEDTLSALQ